MQLTHPTRRDAEAALRAEGYALRQQFWSKQSVMDPFYGEIPVLALCTVEHRRVAPKWGQPDYYEIVFR